MHDKAFKLCDGVVVTGSGTVMHGSNVHPPEPVPPPREFNGVQFNSANGGGMQTKLSPAEP